MKRLRKLFESIAFAGMKPAARPGQMQEKKKLGPLRGSLDRFLSGSAPTDPLYLTNRSRAQRIKAWSLVAVPSLIIVGLVALTLSKGYFSPPAAAPQKELSADEVARKLLPNMARDITLDSNKDVEVLQVHVDHSAMNVAGTVRNNTAYAIAVTDLTLNLTDSSGSQVGAVSGQIENLPPKTNKDFQFPIKQENAVFVLVRELSTSR